MTKEVNAWAMANGCIRVYSGLMDMMTNNEVEAVLGHEMGHVAHVHQTAIDTNTAVRHRPRVHFFGHIDFVSDRRAIDVVAQRFSNLVQTLRVGLREASEQDC